MGWDEWMDGMRLMDGWMGWDRWDEIDGWMDGWDVMGWMDGLTSQYKQMCNTI